MIVSILIVMGIPKLMTHFEDIVTIILFILRLILFILRILTLGLCCEKYCYFSHM